MLRARRALPVYFKARGLRRSAAHARPSTASGPWSGAKIRRARAGAACWRSRPASRLNNTRLRGPGVIRVGVARELAVAADSARRPRRAYFGRRCRAYLGRVRACVCRRYRAAPIERQGRARTAVVDRADQGQHSHADLRVGS